MFHTCVIELSKSALEKNLAFIRSLIGEKTLMSSVVKGNAYGHGIEQFVPLAERCGIKHFSTFSADEAYRVQQMCRDKARIMIMGEITNDQLEWALENDVEFFVFELDRLKAAVHTARLVGKPATVHLELETGMNRTGLEPEVLEEACNFIAKNQAHVKLGGLCTHFAGAESIANYYRVRKQKIIFRRMSKWIKKKGLQPEHEHIACSAAVVRFPETHLQMVRVGIMQYGFWPSQEVIIEFLRDKPDKINPLTPLISWKSRVMDVKHIPEGEYIGYGTSYLANSNMKIATIPVGYGHGFSRSLSNQGRVLIHGQRVGTVGMVNMNAIMADVTLVEGVEKGDEVVLIGRQGENEITVSSFGDYSDQVNYELLTRLPHDIPRRVVG